MFYANKNKNAFSAYCFNCFRTKSLGFINFIMVVLVKNTAVNYKTGIQLKGTIAINGVIKKNQSRLCG